MTVEEFQHDVFICALNSSVCGIPFIRRISPTSLNIRIPITPDTFADVFFNEKLAQQLSP